MDPQATFESFCKAVLAGDYDAAADYQQAYNAWRRKGGFHATDKDERYVLRLDTEQDRYLSLYMGQEAWVSVHDTAGVD